MSPFKLMLCLCLTATLLLAAPYSHSQTADRVRVGADVAQANLIQKVDPVYPPLAQAARVQGAVILEVVINRDGKVASLAVQQGHALLNQAAVEAVKQWGYKPFLLNGQPIEVVTTVTILFSIP